jgi:hypothetical protein
MHDMESDKIDTATLIKAAEESHDAASQHQRDLIAKYGDIDKAREGATLEENRVTAGLQMMNGILGEVDENGGEGLGSIVTTHTADGLVSGAAKVAFDEDNGAFRVLLLGTNGLQSGAGSALMGAIFEAAANYGPGAGVIIDSPMIDANKFYERIGFDTRNARGGDLSLEASEVAAWYDKYIEESGGGSE